MLYAYSFDPISGFSLLDQSERDLMWEKIPEDGLHIRDVFMTLPIIRQKEGVFIDLVIHLLQNEGIPFRYLAYFDNGLEGDTEIWIRNDLGLAELQRRYAQRSAL